MPEGRKVLANLISVIGSTALHHACSLQHCDVVKFLIANKAVVELTDHDGFTAIQLANEDTLLAFMQAVLALRQVSSPEELTVYLCLLLEQFSLNNSELTGLGGT